VREPATSERIRTHWYARSAGSAGGLAAGILPSPDNPTGGKDRRRYVEEMADFTLNVVHTRPATTIAKMQ
jgi:hypothetical protein